MGKCHGADGGHRSNFRLLWLGGRIKDYTDRIPADAAVATEQDQFDDHRNLLKAASRFGGSYVEAIADQEPGKACGNPPVGYSRGQREQKYYRLPRRDNSKRRVVHKFGTIQTQPPNAFR